jgi:hypothetical protein
MATFDSSQPPSPIQRILIFHLDLSEKCLDGKALGEGASIQELSEQILYYHRDQRWAPESTDSETRPSTLPSPRTKLSLTEEAVQFLGLCTALYSLPSSLGDPELEEDKTNEIYFGNSTLVFLLLESSNDLLAVAQVSRLYQKGSKSDSGGGNPLAVRSSIERCHKIFCMLRGGGILHRLAGSQSTQDKKTNDTNQSAYPGMDKLFILQKQLRRAREQIARHGPGGSDIDTLRRQIDALQMDIKTLRKSLPIQSIRRDLDAHYKEFLGDLGLVVSRNGGAGRCLVETVPVPISQDSGSHVFESLPTRISSYSTLSLGLSVRQLLQEFANDDTITQLLGVSTFYQGQLLYTHTWDATIFDKFDCSNRNPDSIAMSNETVCLVMGYIASYRMKMSQLSATKHSSSLPNTPAQPPLGIKRLTLAFGAMADKAAQTFDDNSNVHREQDANNGGYFIPPPPTFMLSAMEHTHSLEGRNKRKVWAPRIHLPILASFEHHSQDLSLDTNVIMFELEGFSFLLYVDCPVEGNVSSEERAVGDFLSKLEGKLSDAVFLASEEDHSGIFPRLQANRAEWIEPGQDLVLVDRAQHKLILFSDRKQVVARDKKTSAPGESPSRRFLGFGSRNQERNANHANQGSSSSLEWAALGMDCRHLLASHLHLDTILAFDDMMNEVAKLKGTSQKPHAILSRDVMDFKTKGTLELCTCMPLGWIYAFIDGDMELYAFFDSSIYVTIEDVQSAALKVQEQLFGHWTSDG